VMAPLTEQLVKAKTRLERLDEVRNLNLWGQELTDVTVLEYMPNVEVLSLSVNKIDKLKDFRHCLKLQELYLRKNEVADLTEVQYLMHLKDLKVLWLCDNPCAEHPRYRLAIIKMLPELLKLDNSEVSPHERAAAVACDFPVPEVPPQPVNAGNRAAASAGHQSSNEYTAASSAPPQRQSSTAAEQQNARRTSPNILYAIFALIAELDGESLRLVHKEVEQRINNNSSM
jgi:cilla- and flagella-associated protein